MWARVDDGWWCHPKVMDVSLTARGLWISALSWSCAQRSPIVPVSFLRIASGSKDEANELVCCGLWEEVEGGWRFHDWDDYQQLSLSEKRAAAGRKGGVASGESRRSPKQTEASAEAGTRPVPSRPEPSVAYAVADAKFRAARATEPSRDEADAAFDDGLLAARRAARSLKVVNE